MEALIDPILPNGEDLDQEITDQQLAEATHEELNQPAAAQTDSQTQPPLETSAPAFRDALLQALQVVLPTLS